METFWLQEVSDTFCPKAYCFSDLGLQIELHEFDCVGSTNAILMEMARNGAPIGSVVWSHKQDTGRGRLGRSFASPQGGVYISMLLPCPSDFKDIGFALTAKAGVAVRRAIKSVCKLDCGIKWVNDVIMDGKKVGGILAQMVSRAGSNCVVMGIGVNYLTPMSSFPNDLKAIVGSLFDGDFVNSKDVPPIRDFVLSLIANVYGLVCGCEQVESEWQNASGKCDFFGKNGAKWLDEYKSSSTILGNEVKVIQAGAVVGEGTAVSIDDDCHLHVLDSNGCEMVLSTGEVSVRQCFGCLD